MTSPNSCLAPLEADTRLGEATVDFVGEKCWSMLPLLPFVRRALRGVAGAGWGRSRGLRLLNLCGPYEASLLGRAAEAVDEMEALARRWASCAAARLGSRDLERTGGDAESELPPGERSKRSARAFTLVDVVGGERGAEAVEAAGPEADLAAGLGVVLAPLPLVVGCRGRVTDMSGACCGEAGAWGSGDV